VTDPTPTPAWAPTVAEVTQLVPSRAKGQYGRVPAFTDDTQPTGDQVQTVIDGVVAKLLGKFGTEVVDALAGSAREVAALRAALLVELTYFGDQIRPDRSAYTELKALYEETLADFLTDRANLGADEEAGTADDTAAGGGMPWYSFPPLCGPVHVPGTESPYDPGTGLDW
jgi:hypothetical protein